MWFLKWPSQNLLFIPVAVLPITSNNGEYSLNHRSLYRWKSLILTLIGILWNDPSHKNKTWLKVTVNHSKRKGLTNCSPILLVPKIDTRFLDFWGLIKCMTRNPMDSFTGSDARCHHLQPLAQRPKCRWLFGGRFYMHVLKTIVASNIGLYKRLGILCWNDLVDSYYIIVFCCICTVWFTAIISMSDLKNYNQSGSPLESLIMNHQLPSEIQFAGLIL